MSVAGSTSSQGTHSRSPSRSRSPPYSDGRYPPSSNNSRYRYDYNNYRPPRSGMSADLDNYRDLRDRERDRERDRDRDRSMLMRDDRYMNPRGRERDRDDRYTPYYREDPHHYPPSSSSSMMPRDYPKISTNPLRRELTSSDPSKDSKIPLSSSSSSIKDMKDDSKPPVTPTNDAPPPASSYPPPPSSRYSDWRERDRDRDRDRDRRYRDDDRRRDYDRRREGYMRDMRYESSSYGAPPPNYQMPPYGGDSYRPERDRDREMPPSPSSHLPYYERDRLDDRDYYSRGPRSSGPSGPMDYDRYRSSGRGRPAWGPNKLDDNRRMMDRDRPERITTNVEIRSGRTSPTSATPTNANFPSKDRPLEVLKSDDKKQESELRNNAESNVSPIEKPSIAATIPEESSLKTENLTSSDAPPISTTPTKDDTLEKGEVIEDDVQSPQKEEDMEALPQAAPLTIETKTSDDMKKEELSNEEPSLSAVEETVNRPISPEPMEVDSGLPPSIFTTETTTEKSEEKPTLKPEQDSSSSPTTTTATTTITSPPFKISLPPQKVELEEQEEEKEEEREEGETTTENTTEEKSNNLTQEQIVERIDDIENQISTYEDLLEAAIKREEEEEANPLHDEEEEDVEMADDEDETAEEEAAQNKEEAKKQALQAMENEPSSSNSTADMMDFSDVSSPIMRKRPQLLINQLRSKNDHLDDELYEKILQDNRTVAQHNSRMVDGIWQGKEETSGEWLDEDSWSKPLYARVEDYPCYKENIANFKKMQISVTHALVSQEKALKEKELRLKAEYKQHYKIWKQKNLYLDHRREDERKRLDRYSSQRGTSRHRKDESEEYTDNVIFVNGAPDALRFKNDGTSTPYGNGYFTSDAARSEAELLEIIQSLESAEMRNPESRAKKTTATIPPMILDSRERMRTYDDRSGLVEDPLTYYHTGPDTGDVWNQQEVTTFMESYMMYPKQFERISIAIGTKTAPQCVLFYYRKKKKIDFKALMKKGRRGKATKHRDRIAAAIRAVTGDSTRSTRKAKSKGSALMTDIGEAQVSRKAKEKDAELKRRELRDSDQESVSERRKTKRPTSSTSNSANTVSVPPVSTPIVHSAPTSSAFDDADMMQHQEKRRTNSGTNATQRRKGPSPREPIHVTAVNDVPIVLPGEPTATKRYIEDLSNTADDDDDKATFLSSASVSGSGSTKWTESEKEMAIDAFKQHGRDFVQVSSSIKTKTEEQCRNFYHNFKRKFGSNAFNEEDSRQVETPTGATAPINVSTTATTSIATSPIQNAVHNEVVALSGRTDLKAEEEDAAAALVDMFQMGANTPREEKNSVLTSRSRTPSSHEDLHVNTATTTAIATPTTATTTTTTITTTTTPAIATAIAPQPAVGLSKSVGPSSPSSSQAYIAPSQQQQQQQRRRRVRSTSSRSDSVTDDTSEWTDPDYGAKAGGRKLGRTTTLADAKRPTYSSYWSVSERNEFSRYLTMYGRDWEKVANAMKSKTMIQVRNFYANNEEKLNLKEYVNQHQARQQQQQQQQQPPPSLPEVPPKRDMPNVGTSFDTSAAHFQALQNFPFPAPITDQTPSPTILSSSPKSAQVQSIKPNNNTTKGSPYMINRTGYLSSSTPPPTRVAPSSSSPSSDSVYSNSPRVNYPSSTATRPIAQAPPQPLPSSQSIPSQQQRPHQLHQQQQPTVEAPSAVTKVADLLNNNDDPAEPSQNSWETWFGS